MRIQKDEVKKMIALLNETQTIHSGTTHDFDAKILSKVEEEAGVAAAKFLETCGCMESAKRAFNAASKVVESAE